MMVPLSLTLNSLRAAPQTPFLSGVWWLINVVLLSHYEGTHVEEASLQLVLDRAAIHDTIVRFALALDMHDWELYRSCSDRQHL
jgi:hypothetical protein